MFKLKKLFPCLMAFTLICMAMFPMEGVAQSEGSTNKNKEIEALADELEYIFTTILVKDEMTGNYLLNEEALKNSHYTEEEQEMLLEVAKNQGGIGLSNTFDRCMQDLLGISSWVWKEIKSYIDAGQYLAAAGAIFVLADIVVSPITIAVFLFTCGPSSAG